MINLDLQIKKTQLEGYKEEDATAKVCQDIILNAISRSSLSKIVTIKGGVVMRSISNNARRATQDIDIDFIRYSLSDDSIRVFINELNNIDGLKIQLYGKLEELKQQDYKGKRAYIKITDSFGCEISSKVDFGVHKHLDVKQEVYCFDIATQDDGVSLLINSKEQMFTEKLRSFLKFGTRSTRYKDVFDLYWLCFHLDKKELLHCFDLLIFSDSRMKEKTVDDIHKRISKIFENQDFRFLISSSNKNWVDVKVEQVFERIIKFLQEI